MAIDKIFNDANVDGIADNIFGAVNNSVSEVKQMQQRKAAENVQMVVEAFKKIETNITEKFDNVTDVIEKRVLTIKDGRDGSSGSDGRNGRDGKPGRDGVNGKQGTPGTPGKDGTDGVDGVSVTNANIDFDGSLVISLSTGQQINVGEIVPPELEKQIKVISTMSTNGAVGIKDEGTSITAGVKIINFVGATVTATNSGDDVTVNVSSGTGTVTSVAATVPAFLSVAGSPITTTGTLAISLSGTALPVANGGTGITSFGTGVATALGVNTGTAGAFVVNGGALGTPSSGTLTSATGLPISTGVSGLGTDIATALAVNVGTAGAPVVNGGALGTPSSGTVTNLTGTASININGTVGATTPGTGAFTSLTASTTLGVTGVSTLTAGAVVQGLTVGRGPGAVSTNTAVGASALAANTTGAGHTALGYQAGNSVTTNNGITAIGAGAGALSTASGGTFLGGDAGGSVSTGGANTFLGNGAGYYVTSGASNTIVGTYTGNQDSLDIRTASNYIVLSDGGGNRQITMKEGQTLALDSAVPNAGTGITFPATQSASADANTLDDYEEGTWTPSLGGTAVYNILTGTYTKVGNVVTITGSIRPSSLGTGSVNTVTGLPFSVAGDAFGGIAFGDGWAVSVYSVFLYLSGTSLEVRGFTASGTSTPVVNLFQTNARIFFTATYLTS